MRSPLFNRRHIVNYLLYGGCAAIGYALMAAIFITHNQFHYAWWLYVGNTFFMLFIFLYSWKLTTMKQDNLSAMTMLMAGHMATVTGIILAVIFCFGLMAMLVPQVFQRVPDANGALANAPAATGPDRVHGMVFIIFINVTIANFCIGSFISLISSYAIKRNQTRDKPAPLQ